MSVTCPKCSFTGTGRSLGKHVEKCGVTPTELFFSKVNKGGDGGCWIWTGYCQKFGHGWTRNGLAHRVSWELLRGPIEDDKCLLHRCDNPPCVNPDHLFIGDRQANARDAKAKGRTTFGAKNCTAKLTEAQVIQILALKGTATQDVIASRYGVSQTAIAAIFKGRSWAYLHERRGPQSEREG